MKAIHRKPLEMRGDKTLVEAFIVADTTPETLPTTGENITGLSPDDIFAPFSVLYVIADAETKLYLANESGQFVPQ